MDASWRPIEGRYWYGGDGLTEGMLIAIDHHGYRHKPWRVHEVHTREGDERLHVILRPDGDLFDLAQHNKSVAIGKHARIYKLPEHYALCHSCSELPPCSEVWTEKVSAADAERSSRFEVEGICPSCQKPVTYRQRSHRFSENLYVPLGPPVTFHARRACEGGAVQYDEALAKRNDTQPRLSCEGHVTQHRDGERACTNITCPGDRLRHRSFAMCYVLAEKCNRPECWAIDDTATRAHRENGSTT